MSEPTEATVTLVPAVSEIDAAAWDQCANPDASAYNPFVAHAFLKALEDAGCVGQGTGWLPRHLVLTDENGMIAGVAPSYVKTHSQGEYVFDHGWADAYMQAGGRYYPKLQMAVPFTPVPGPRLMVRRGPRASADEQFLAAAAIEVARQNGLSSVHLTFLDSDAQQRLGELGFLARTGQQFHWHNKGYRDFEDFLDGFASRKRKTVRKERIEALAPGITVEHLTGRAITDTHWDSIFEFYMDTSSRKWGRPYLNRKFFSVLGQSMSEHCLLVMAKRNGRYIAGALNMIGGDCLYGRYWGAVEQHPSLHFEVCYYQAIEYAISHGLARVEAGAQGEHKLARGYLPVETYSAHWIADLALKRAIEKFLRQEREHVVASNAELAGMGPYRNEQD